MRGKVYLIGAGPGDPGLLTLKGRDGLRSADVVIYDALVNPQLLDWCRPGAQKIYVGKRGHRSNALMDDGLASKKKGSRGGHAIEQKEINEMMRRHARRGRRVV